MPIPRLGALPGCLSCPRPPSAVKALVDFNSTEFYLFALLSPWTVSHRGQNQVLFILVSPDMGPGTGQVLNT